MKLFQFFSRCGRAGVLLAAVVMFGVNSAYGQEPKPDANAGARGARLWVQTCGSCHNFREPRDYRDDQWKSVISHMRVRAGLTGPEARDILKFLQSAND